MESEFWPIRKRGNFQEIVSLSTTTKKLSYILSPLNQLRKTVDALKRIALGKTILSLFSICISVDIFWETRTKKYIKLYEIYLLKFRLT